MCGLILHGKKVIRTLTFYLNRVGLENRIIIIYGMCEIAIEPCLVGHAAVFRVFAHRLLCAFFSKT